MKVLYIDDEANLEKMASKFDILKDEGIDVLRVTRVYEVMPTLQAIADTISLIVLDIIMPPEQHYTLAQTEGGTTTGLQLLKDIRSHYKDIPIIIVSIRKRTLAAGILSTYEVSEYLEGPIPAIEIARTIKQVTGARKRSVK